MCADMHKIWCIYNHPTLAYTLKLAVHVDFHCHVLHVSHLTSL